MDLYNYIAAAAAIYLIFIGGIIRAEALWARLLARVVPIFLGVLLGFFVVARFMGWPTWF